MPSRPARRTAVSGRRRIHRGRIRLARGDGDGALEDAEPRWSSLGGPASLSTFSRHSHSTRGRRLERAPEQAEASVAELLDGAGGRTAVLGLPGRFPTCSRDGGRGTLDRAAAPARAWPRRGRAGTTPSPRRSSATSRGPPTSMRRSDRSRTRPSRACERPTQALAAGDASRRRSDQLAALSRSSAASARTPTCATRNRPPLHHQEGRACTTEEHKEAGQAFQPWPASF